MSKYELQHLYEADIAFVEVYSGVFKTFKDRAGEVENIHLSLDEVFLYLNGSYKVALCKEEYYHSPGFHTPELTLISRPYLRRIPVYANFKLQDEREENSDAEI